jgi:predicted lipoprotein with Yx(FWY)xxD motif
MKRLLSLVAGAGALAVIVAGCGGGGYGATTTGAAARSSASPPAKIATRTTRLGRVLVDGRGRTLYLFEKDRGPASRCYGACASIWPPATTTGTAVAGPGIAAAKLGTTKRSDGKLQVTYNGHPLYRYAADAKPGDVNGQGLNQFGAKWYVLNGAGSKIDDD